MELYKIHLIREYIVEIEAENADIAREFTETHVTGEDLTKNFSLKNPNFNIISVDSVLNETVDIT